MPKSPTLPKVIEYPADVARFFAYLYLVDGTSFHPDDSFFRYGKVQYVDEAGKPFYTHVKARIRDRLMKQSREILDQTKIDIYEVGLWTAAILGVHDDPEGRTSAPIWLHRALESYI